MWMNNVRTQNVLKVLHLLILNNFPPSPPPAPPPLSLFLFYPSAPFSLSLRSGVSLSGSVLQRWILQLSPAPGPKQKPRSSLGGGRLGQKAQPIWKQKHSLFHLSFSILIWSLSSALFLFAELVSLFVSAQLPGPFGSLRHWLLCGLCEYLMVWDHQMFMCNINIKCISLRLTVSTLCLMQLFGALLRGCCADLSFLNLSKNSFSHRLVISLKLPKQQKQLQIQIWEDILTISP